MTTAPETPAFTPGIPHPDPFLARKGWEMCPCCGVYVRKRRQNG